MPTLGEALNKLNISDFFIDEFGRLIVHNPEVIDAVATQHPGLKNIRQAASNNCNCPDAFQSAERLATNPITNRQK